MDVQRRTLGALRLRLGWPVRRRGRHHPDRTGRPALRGVGGGDVGGWGGVAAGGDYGEGGLGVLGAGGGRG